ncbi:MAG: response regulator transcription factor [Lewinellaceae bacterium]|nr:response regulator transcription factor [Lewinellaceae bacterium]
MLSVSCDLSVIRDSLQKGACGYASKEISKQELLHAITTVARGEIFLDQTALQEVVGLLVKKTPKSLLTRRELEVSQLYVVGKQIKEIAAELYISEDTVESHIKNIRAKTDASSRYEVAEYLKKNGLADE